MGGWDVGDMESTINNTSTRKREYNLLSYLVLAVSKSAAGLYAYNLVKFREHWWCFTNISQQPLRL